MSGIITIRGIPKTEKKIFVVEEKEYTKIPDKFIDKTEWPSTCNLNCYTCTRVINGTPLFIPASVEETYIPKLDNTVYCSPSCAVSRIITLPNNELYIKFLRILIYRITGKFITSIDKSEDKSLINFYGGSLTIQQYKDKLYDLNSEWFSADIN